MRVYKKRPCQMQPKIHLIIENLILLSCHSSGQAHKCNSMVFSPTKRSGTNYLIFTVSSITHNCINATVTLRETLMSPYEKKSFPFFCTEKQSIVVLMFYFINIDCRKRTGNHIQLQLFRLFRVHLKILIRYLFIQRAANT